MLLVKYKEKKRKKILENFATLSNEDKLIVIQQLKKEEKNLYTNKSQKSRIKHKFNDNIAGLSYEFERTGYLPLIGITSILGNLVAGVVSIFKYNPIEKNLKESIVNSSELQDALWQLSVERLNFYLGSFAVIETAILASFGFIYYYTNNLQNKPSKLCKSKKNIHTLIEELEKELSKTIANNKEVMEK